MAKWQPGFDFSSHVSAGVVSTSGGMRESFTDLYGARGDDNINVCAVPHNNYLMNIPTEGGFFVT